MRLRPVTVLSVAFPFAPVRPDTAGGAEQVLGMLDRALVERGHVSIVLASRGSRVRGLLAEMPAWKGSYDDEDVRRRAWETYAAAIRKALARWPVDAVHLHGLDFVRYLPPPGVPVIATLHLPPSFYPEETFRTARPGTLLQCVSASQRAACPPGAVLPEPIENGVFWQELQGGEGARDYAVALGRICPEKGFHIAARAASRARIRLRLAGEVYPYESHRRYFRTELSALIEGGAHEYLGAVGPEQKKTLLGGARCLLAPSLVEETSSLSAMEALACGTPVIAFPAGALAGIVDHGRTGFLVRSEEEMADAIARADSIDPEECRRAARERFSADRMASEYIALYRRAILQGARTGTEAAA